MKRFGCLFLALCLLFGIAACVPHQSDETILYLAAAASLEQVLEQELIPLFEATHEGMRVQGTYGGSFHLQTQIELGLEADLFLSAALSAITDLEAQGMVVGGAVVPLVENRLVLIAPRNLEPTVTGFHDILNAQSIAIGDPASVPAGRYAGEVFTYLGIWDEVRDKASLGTDVSAVLQWVDSGNAEVGVVYATDALRAENVVILAEAPPESLATQILLTAGLLANTQDEAAARLFLEFLQSPAARRIFEAYGFTPYS